MADGFVRHGGTTLAVDANLLLYPAPYFSRIIVIHENAQHATSLMELAGKRVVDSALLAQYLESRYPGHHPDPVSNPAGAVRSCPGIPTRCRLQGQRPACPSWKTTRICGSATSTIPAQSGLSIGVRSDWPELHSILSKALYRSSLPSGDLSTTAVSRQRRCHLPALPSGPACSALKSSCPSCC
ncbi:MAG: hypothetical protein ACLRWP_12375 [Bilophila wadsworthia]